MTHLLTPKNVGDILEQIDGDEQRHYPCTSGAEVVTLDVGEILKAQLRKTIAEIEALFYKFPLDPSSFNEVLYEWLEAAKKEVGS